MAMGLPPTNVRKLRAMAANATGVGDSGRCTTYTIALAIGEDRDPAVRCRAEAVKEWCVMWRSSPRLRSRLAKSWHTLLPRLAWQYDWKAVRGPIGAMICMLRDVDWVPLRANLWGPPKGELWQITGEHIFLQPLIYEFAQTINMDCG